MAEANVSKTSVVATTEQAVEYITNVLVNGELHMKAACKELGWSFPRIRSRALTIAKKMKCTFMKTSRGVYILEPLKQAVSIGGPPPEIKTTEDPGAVINSDSHVEGADTDYALDPDEVEAALLGNNDSTPNV